MIQFNLPTVASDETILRPIATEVVKDIQNFIGFSSDVHIEHTQDPDGFINKYWRVGTTKDKQLKSALVTMAYEEEMTPDQLNAMQTRGPNDARPLLYDKAGFYLQPVVGMSTLRLSITVSSNSKTKINNILTKFKMLMSMGKDIQFHKLSYHYYLPNAIYMLLEEIAKARSVFIEPTTAEEYIAMITDDRAEYIGTTAGKDGKILLGFVETYQNVLGRFTTGLNEIKPTYDQDNGYYSIEFEYETIISKPLSFNVIYRPVLYGVNLDAKFIRYQNPDPSFKPAYMPSNMAADYAILQERAKVIREYIYKHKYLHIPEYDTHTDFMVPPSDIPLFTVLLSFDPDNPTFLFNLKSMGDYKLSDFIIGFLLSGEYQYIIKHLQSVFQLHLVINGEVQTEELLSVDADLNVYITTTVDYTKTYHVMFTYVYQPGLLAPGAWERYLAYLNNYQETIGNVIDYTGSNDLPTMNLDIIGYLNALTIEQETNKDGAVMFTTLVSELLACTLERR